MADGIAGPAAAAAAQPNSDSPSVGTRIEVFWPDDDVHYAGQVDGYTTGGKTVVLYDDGDKEELDLSAEVWRLEGVRSIAAGKSPVMPQRPTSANPTATVAAQKTVDRQQSAHDVIDSIAHPSIASRAAPTASVVTAPLAPNQRTVPEVAPAPARASMDLPGQHAAAPAASHAPGTSLPARAQQAKAEGMDVVSRPAASMTAAVPRADRMSIDSPEPKSKPKGRMSTDGAKGSSSKSGRGRGRPKKTASKRAMQDRSPGNPSKKSKSSRPTHGKEIEIAARGNLTSSPQQVSKASDVMSPASQEGATVSAAKSSGSAVRNASPKASSKNKQTITPSEVLRSASDVRALAAGEADIGQLRSLVEQLGKQLAADIRPLSKGITELAPVAKRVDEISPAVARAVKVSEDVKTELIPLQKQIVTLGTQAKETQSMYARTVENLNNELKENVGRLAKDIAQLSKISNENSSVLTQTAKENDRLSKMYTSLASKVEGLTSAVAGIKTLVQNMSNKINENSKNELSLERPDGRSRVIADGAAPEPAKLSSTKQEMDIDVQYDEEMTTSATQPVASSSASHFRSTGSVAQVLDGIDGNAVSSTQASNMGSRHIKPNGKPTPTVVVAESVVAPMPVVEYADMMSASAVKKRGRLLLGQACLVWFLDGASRRDEPVPPNTMAHPRWAVETASLCLKTVSEELKKSKTEKAVLDSYKNRVTLPTDLEWFTEPSDVNLEKARRNYVKWIPPLRDWEWEIERKALTSVARRVGEAERSCLVEKTDSALTFALRVINTAMGPRKPRM